MCCAGFGDANIGFGDITNNLIISPYLLLNWKIARTVRIATPYGKIKRENSRNISIHIFCAVKQIYGSAVTFIVTNANIAIILWDLKSCLLAQCYPENPLYTEGYYLFYLFSTTMAPFLHIIGCGFLHGIVKHDLKFVKYIGMSCIEKR
jgi:hypothetical protein